MLSTDTNTISITLPSLPLPQPVFRRHPQVNPRAETNAEGSIQSQGGPGEAVLQEELFLPFQPQQRWLHWQLVQGAMPKLFAGQHQASPDLLSSPAPSSAQGSAHGTPCPSTIPQHPLPQHHPMAPPAPALTPDHPGVPLGELGQSPPALPLCWQ